MKNESPIQQKSYRFAMAVVELNHNLIESREFVLANQILKSGTSIGANVEEAVGAQSDNDFFMKITIAYKEARESKYWIRLLKDCKLINQGRANSLLEDVEEILKLLGTIQKTLKYKKSK